MSIKGQKLRQHISETGNETTGDKNKQIQDARLEVYDLRPFLYPGLCTWIPSRCDGFLCSLSPVCSRCRFLEHTRL